jgi:hypothetical protein
VTQLFGGTRGQDVTDAILADGKFGIGYMMGLVTNAILTIELVWYWVPYVNSNIKLYW